MTESKGCFYHTCPRCGFHNYEILDLRVGYCGNCKEFYKNMEKEKNEQKEIPTSK